MIDHWCELVEEFPIEKYHQLGRGKGTKVLLVGESPAPNGWRKSGKACYTEDGKLLPTGKRLNELLDDFGLSVETCGFTELVKCYVGKDRKLLLQCSQKCWLIFLKQLTLGNYKILIILGVETLNIFGNLTGSKLTTGELVKIQLNDKEYYLLGIYHPSPINPTGREKNKKIFQRLKSEIENIIGN